MCALSLPEQVCPLSCHSRVRVAQKRAQIGGRGSNYWREEYDLWPSQGSCNFRDSDTYRISVDIVHGHNNNRWVHSLMEYPRPVISRNSHNRALAVRKWRQIIAPSTEAMSSYMSCLLFTCESIYSPVTSHRLHVQGVFPVQRDESEKLPMLRKHGFLLHFSHTHLPFTYLKPLL
jgi:hypothetical protein